ncbi:hypothetical protein RFI_05088 [Reticulomyxa filosa]|uniref:Uncharacterized protein n=1 Tax=Reticulomyxa filosa TaxID=46433 RepID=X6P1B0_RETFI|nr:hypothetical protein RFI_05088 [Reticulomyxa filosa]|eukprot:ETO32026.1 hypothetical protein RFI_05088 [Reticulomyxa filosa]
MILNNRSKKQHCKIWSELVQTISKNGERRYLSIKFAYPKMKQTTKKKEKKENMNKKKKKTRKDQRIYTDFRVTGGRGKKKQTQYKSNEHQKKKKYKRMDALKRTVVRLMFRDYV